MARPTGVTTILPEGRLVYGMQLPIQSQSTIYAEPWEAEADADDLAAHRAGGRSRRLLLHRRVRPHRDPGATGRSRWAPRGGTRSPRSAGWPASPSTSGCSATSTCLPYRHPLQAAKAFVDARRRVGRPGDPRRRRRPRRGRVRAARARLRRAGRACSTRRSTRCAPRSPTSTRRSTGRRGRSRARASARGRSRPAGRPIWVGGSSKPALRRAAERGDGWLPQGPVTPEARRVHPLRDRRSVRGRRPDRHRRASPGRSTSASPTWDVGAAPDRAAREAGPRARASTRRMGVGQVQIRLPLALGRRAGRPDRALRRRGRSRARCGRPTGGHEVHVARRTRSPSCRASARAWAVTSRWRSPQQGADIVLGGRTEAKLEAVAEEVEALGRRALPVRCDVVDPDACSELARPRRGRARRHRHPREQRLRRRRREVGARTPTCRRGADDRRQPLRHAADDPGRSLPHMEAQRRRPHRDDQHDVDRAHPGEVRLVRRVEERAARR